MSINLNEQQKNIVENAIGKIAVVAGAGSGKTSTNIELISKLNIINKIPLEKMFITTFTNKSGKDLKSKLSKKLSLDQKYLDNLWIGTFHGLGYRYLTQVKKKKIEIILPLEARQYLKNIYNQVCKEFNVDEEKFSFIVALNNIDKKRNKSCSWSDASEFPEPCEEIFNIYQNEKIKMGLVDYEDILQYFYDELKNDNIFRNRFDWVFVDESQDSNPRQVSIADLISNKNQVLIGDPKQAIYSFRGSAPELFKSKIGEADKVFNLSYNYRSSKEIIEFANALLPQMPSFQGQNLIPTKISNEKPNFTLCDNQVFEVLKNIEKDIREKIPLEEIAVIGRSIKPLAFQNLQLALRARNIPYVLRGGDDKLNASYMQNYLSVLKSVIKPTKISLTNSLGIIPGVGPKISMKLAEDVMAYGGSFEPLVNCSAKFTTSRCYSAFLKLEDYKNNNKEILLKTLDFIHDYYLVPVYGKKDPLEPSNKKKIIFDSLYKYLIEYKDIVEGIDSLYVNEDDSNSDKGKIVITTAHQSKGLEWDSVHILNFCEGSFPTLKLDEEDNISRLEEEFCLTYVAVTRARKKLNMYMSFLSDSYGNKPNKFSRFLRFVFLSSKEKYFNFKIFNVSSESKYKEDLYNKMKSVYG